MSIIANFVERIFGGGEPRFIGEKIFWQPFGVNAAGVPVSPDTALSITAYFDAINTISADIASLPLPIYRKDEKGDRQQLPDHIAHNLLNVSPDGETPAVRFRQASMGHVLGHGNSYIEIVRFGNNDPASLHLLDTRTTEPVRLPDKGLVYRLGDGRILPPYNVIHIAGLSYDGLIGYTPAEIMRNALGLTIASEKYSAAFMGNAARPGGLLKTKATFQDVAAAQRLVENFNKAYAGAANAGSTILLEGGTEFQPISIKPLDAELLLTRQFQILEIARMFKIPPHKLGDWSQAHFANAEVAERYYYITTIRPWLVSIEQEFNRKLFRPSESVYVEHNMEGRLRGTQEERATHYREMQAMGVYTVNDILRLENRPTIGPEGDRRWISQNLKPANELTNEV